MLRVSVVAFAVARPKRQKQRRLQAGSWNAALGVEQGGAAPPSSLLPNAWFRQLLRTTSERQMQHAAGYSTSAAPPSRKSKATREELAAKPNSTPMTTLSVLQPAVSPLESASTRKPQEARWWESASVFKPVFNAVMSGMRAPSAPANVIVLPVAHPRASVLLPQAETPKVRRRNREPRGKLKQRGTPALRDAAINELLTDVGVELLVQKVLGGHDDSQHSEPKRQQKRKPLRNKKARNASDVETNGSSRPRNGAEFDEDVASDTTEVVCPSESGVAVAQDFREWRETIRELFSSTAADDSQFDDSRRSNVAGTPPEWAAEWDEEHGGDAAHISEEDVIRSLPGRRAKRFVQAVGQGAEYEEDEAGASRSPGATTSCNLPAGRSSVGTLWDLGLYWRPSSSSSSASAAQAPLETETAIGNALVRSEAFSELFQRTSQINDALQRDLAADGFFDVAGERTSPMPVTDGEEPLRHELLREVPCGTAAADVERARYDFQAFAESCSEMIAPLPHDRQVAVVWQSWRLHAVREVTRRFAQHVVREGSLGELNEAQKVLSALGLSTSDVASDGSADDEHARAARFDFRCARVERILKAAVMRCWSVDSL